MDDGRSQEPGSEVVARIARTPYERFLLGDPAPLCRHQVEPNVTRIVGETVAQSRQFARPIVIHRARGQFQERLLRHGQPVSRPQRHGWVESETRREEGTRRPHLDAMLG